MCYFEKEDFDLELFKTQEVVIRTLVYYQIK